MAVLVWAAIMKCHTLGSLNTRLVFLSVLETGKCKVKVLQGLVSGETLPGLQMAIFSLYPHMVGNERALVFSSSYKGTNCIMGASPS